MRNEQETQKNKYFCLWIERELHDVVGVSLEDSGALPALFPVPHFDEHVVTAAQQQRLSGMDGHRANVVSVGFPGMHFVQSVVVVDANVHVVAASQDP